MSCCSPQSSQACDFKTNKLPGLFAPQPLPPAMSPHLYALSITRVVNLHGSPTISYNQLIHLNWPEAEEAYPRGTPQQGYNVALAFVKLLGCLGKSSSTSLQMKGQGWCLGEKELSYLSVEDYLSANVQHLPPATCCQAPPLQSLNGSLPKKFRTKQKRTQKEPFWANSCIRHTP